MRMKFCIVPTCTLRPKAIDSDEPRAIDSTRPCRKFLEKLLRPEGHLFVIFERLMVHKGTFKRLIRCIKKMACHVHMVAQPSSHAYKKNAVRFSAHPVKRSVEKKYTSLRQVQAFARM